MEYQWNDGLHSAGRYPRLYLARGGQAVKFAGESIPGYCFVVTTKFEKAGKWSNMDYRLELLSGVRPLELLSPMHGIWGQDLASWGEVAEKLSLPVDAVREIVAKEFPRTARRLDEVETLSIELEATGASSETVVVAFGSPSNRRIAEGYWDQPKSALCADGITKVVVAPTYDDSGASRRWDRPTVVEPEGARIVSARHSPGMHGGTWAIEVLVPVAG